MALGSYDANGIWHYGESDNIALFSDTLNKLADSASSAITADRSRIATLEAGSLAGMIPIVPTSVDKSGGTVSISTTGTVTFTGVSSLSLNNCFNNNFAHYLVVFTATNSSAACNFGFRLRSAGSDLSTSGYQSVSMRSRSDNSTVINAGADVNSIILSGGSTNAVNLAGELKFYNPKAAQYTYTAGQHQVAETATLLYAMTTASRTQNTNQYDGLTFYPSAGTITGTIAVYGWND